MSLKKFVIFKVLEFVTADFVLDNYGVYKYTKNIYFNCKYYKSLFLISLQGRFHGMKRLHIIILIFGLADILVYSNSDYKYN